MDLYIFQTGRKLGKRATGVENYYESEKILVEAYADMAKEKKTNIYTEGDESMYDIETKIQDAYRKNDLDLMDSLDKKVERSAAFREKFLYKRNEIQAYSIDTILKNSSLFVGVGVAHLPGDRGVIELLRQKGYTLRPIKMSDRDAKQKESIDKLSVPLPFYPQQAEDSFYSVSVPGKLYDLNEAYQRLDRQQFSDMTNGCYYLITRVKTHAAFIGKSEKEILKEVDSMLYENIPGKIISKQVINNNGYQGYDIVNRTRIGDLQRYNIFVSPFEILIFKMAGKENYIQGKEATKFFSSIKLKKLNTGNYTFSPQQGGFAIQMPHQPVAYLNTNIDNDERWEYEAIDKSTGNAYLVFKKSLLNFRILEADTFDLHMSEESFRSADFFDKQLDRKVVSFKGYPSIYTTEKLKDQSTVFARYFISGPDYYVVAARTKNDKKTVEPFLNSFKFEKYQYNDTKNYVDTFMNFSVQSAVIPVIDEDLRALVEKTEESSPYITYWSKTRNGFFKNKITGEAVNVNVQTYPKYFHIRDTAKFWKEEIDSYLENKDLILSHIDSFQMNSTAKGYRFSVRDTASSKQVNRMILLKDNALYSMVSMGDTTNNKSIFIDSFYNSFLPLNNKPATLLLKSKTNIFFDDLFSTDSVTNSRAVQAIPSVYFDETDIPLLIASISRLKKSDKKYLDIKSSLIAQLGFIKDTSKPVIIDYLKKLYEQTADTSIFQNSILAALINQQTRSSFSLLKELILQDPPVVENNYDYVFLDGLSDSLQLARNLFPEFLELTVLEDYKPKILQLLAKLADSGYIKPKDYESYFYKIYFDAKVELKKQLSKDGKLMEAEFKKEDGNSVMENYNTYDYNNYNYNKNDNLYNNAVLLMPFYDNNPAVKKIFDKLVVSKDPKVQLKFATLLLKNNKQVKDSIFKQLADKSEIRADLYTALQKIKRLDKFPATYNNQLEVARAFLIGCKNYTKIDSTVFMGKTAASYNLKSGVVYFFKYKVKKEDDWKIGISGLLPEDEKVISIEKTLVFMTDKKLKDDEPEINQFHQQLKQLLISMHKGGKYFYENTNYGMGYPDYYDN
ncbi:MAG: TraB/GumN family protein [Chitinophagaceae bacterium]|nr:TraB/GumN family protein [Chitinophagaceae bacterium]